MVQNYTPVMWDDKAFAFVPYEAFGDLPHYPKEKCEQICKELNSLIRLCTYRPKKGRYLFSSGKLCMSFRRFHSYG